PSTHHRNHLSLHDALPIFSNRHAEILTLLDWHRTGLSATQLAYELFGELAPDQLRARLTTVRAEISRLRKLLDKSHRPIALHSQDRKSTRLNSSHVSISYA